MEQDKQFINTELSLLEKDESIISDVQKEMMEDEISEFNQIKENDINISTVYIYEDKDEVEAKVYFRNGFSKNINFEYVPLIVINSKDEIIASKVFDLQEMGDIPPCSARPWKLCFNKSEVDMSKFSPSDCKIIFADKIKAVSYANIQYEEFTPELEPFKIEFENFLQNLPKIERGNLSISKFNISLQQGGKLIVTLVARNSTDKALKIEELPVAVINEDGEAVASGVFNLDNFIVNSMKAKIFMVAFETNFNNEEGIILDKWNVSFNKL